MLSEQLLQEFQQLDRNGKFCVVQVLVSALATVEAISNSVRGHHSARLTLNSLFESS